jgi:hypothetical protein
MQLKIGQIKGNSEAPEYWASKNLGERGKGTKTKAKQNSKNWTPQSTSFFLKQFGVSFKKLLYLATIIRHFVSINSQQRRIASCWFVISKSAGDFARGDSASPSAAGTRSLALLPLPCFPNLSMNPIYPIFIAESWGLL